MGIITDIFANISLDNIQDFVIEVNISHDGKSNVFHIQTEKFRIEMTEAEFFELVGSIFESSYNLRRYKSFDE